MKCWFFQRNPKRFDWHIRENIKEAFEDAHGHYIEIPSHSEGWKAVRYSKEMEEGDVAFFWVSGKKGGLEGWGRVLGNAYKEGKENRIKVSTELLLKEPILKVEIKAGKEMAKHAFFNGGAAGTNHRCDVKQATELNSLLEKANAPVPNIKDAEPNLPNSSRSQAEQISREWLVDEIIDHHRIDLDISPGAERLLNCAINSLKQKNKSDRTLSTTTLFFAAVEWGAQSRESGLTHFSEQAKQILTDNYDKQLEKFFRTVPPVIDSELSPSDYSDIKLSGNMQSILQSLSDMEHPASVVVLLRAMLSHIASDEYEGSYFNRRFPEFQNSKDQLQAALISSASKYVHSDVWTVEDRLGYSQYARAIKAFIESENTQPPMTISIQAPWGGGKSSLMHMLRKELDPWIARQTPYSVSVDTSRKAKHKPQLVEKQEANLSAKEADSIIEQEAHNNNPAMQRVDDSGFITIWFNAWTFQSHQQVWAGLGNTIIKGVTDRLGLLEREKFLFRLNLSRVDSDLVRTKLYDAIFQRFWRLLASVWALIIPAIIAVSIFIADCLPDHWNLPDSGILGTVFGGIGSAFTLLWKAKSDSKKEPAKVALSEYLSVPEYNEELGFVHNVTEDLKKLLEILPKENGKTKPIVLFIDDLDRCSPTKVAEVFEAINLFVAGEFPNCFVVLGMDSEIVAAALEKAHEGVIGKLPAYGGQSAIGWRFMDKFVQLPFVVPTISPKTAKKFASHLAKENFEEIVENISTDGGEEGFGHDQAASNAKQLEGKENSNESNPNEVRPVIAADNLESTEVAPIQEETNALLDTKIESQNRDPANIENLLKRGFEVFSNNPRALKRLTNVFRFYMNLRAAREVNLDEVPSISQLQNWVILSLAWPDFARWLKRGTKLIHNTDKAEGAEMLHTKELLRRLEAPPREPSMHIPEEPMTMTVWTTRLEQLVGLKVETEGSPNWLSDERLFHFFQTMKTSSKDGSLADGTGKGFW